MPKYIIEDDENEDVSHSKKKRKTKTTVTPVIKEKKINSNCHFRICWKRIAVALCIIAIFTLAIMGCKYAFSFYSREMKNEKELATTDVYMPDVNGFDIDAAKETLTRAGLAYNINYVNDNLYIYDTIIKTNVEMGSPVKKNTCIELYVSDSESAKKGAYNVSVGNFDYEKNHIRVSDLTIDAESQSFLLTIVNESNIIIDTIQYTVCYTSPEGVKYGSRTYIKYDAALSPQKKITLSNPIKSDSDAQISIGKIVCTVKK